MAGLLTAYKVEGERGITALEGALCFSFLLTLVCGAFVTIEYLWTSNMISRVVDDRLYGSALRPLRIDVEQGRIVSRTREPEIREFIDQIVNEAAREVEENFASWSQGQFVVEGTYRKIQIDPESGGLGLISDPEFVVRTLSRDFPKQYLDMDWSHEFEQVANWELASVGGVNLPQVAIPRGAYGIEGQAGRFLPETILVGMRITVRYPEGFSAWLRNMAGLQGSITAAKAVVLRGVAD